MASVSAELHKQGIRLRRYLDDWLLLVSSYQEALNSTQVLLWLCAWLGICINFDKSYLRPGEELVFLGVNIMTPPLKAFLMQTQLDNLIYHFQVFLNSPHPTAKEGITLLGHMAFLIHLVPGAQLQMQSLQFHLWSQWSSST